MSFSFSLRELCVATRCTLQSIAMQHVGDGGDTATGCVAAIAGTSSPTAANQVIMAMRGLYDHIPPGHVVPLSGAIEGLEVDGECGDQCRLVAELLDSMIEHEA